MSNAYNSIKNGLENIKTINIETNKPLPSIIEAKEVKTQQDIIPKNEGNNIIKNNTNKITDKYNINNIDDLLINHNDKQLNDNDNDNDSIMSDISNEDNRINKLSKFEKKRMMLKKLKSLNKRPF